MLGLIDAPSDELLEVITPNFFGSLRRVGTIVFHRIFGLPWGDYRRVVRTPKVLD